MCVRYDNHRIKNRAKFEKKPNMYYPGRKNVVLIKDTINPLELFIEKCQFFKTTND